jgi:hypothetical protein
VGKGIVLGGREENLPTTYRNRRAASVESDHIRVTVTQEGGHVAEILDKQSGVNPLWTPPWPSIEPSTFSKTKNPEYGDDPENQLLSGIMGHNLCLDIFGGPSPDEFAAGIGVHGEGSVAPYQISEPAGALVMRATLPIAQIRFERRIELHGSNVRFLEKIESLASFDRPIGWTQHVTLGPPFLARGTTEFRASATHSKVFEGDFGTAAYLQAGSEFEWPNGPGKNGGSCDLRVYNSSSVSGAFTTHLMSPDREHAYFTAFSPSLKVAIGYVWKQKDFPWLGIWEENCSRGIPPWNGKTITRGMEFGVSPFPETRRQMIERGSLFGVPGYRWLPAKGRLEAEYWASVRAENSVPESMAWPLVK